MTYIWEKLTEALRSVLPVALIVLALHFTLVPLPFWVLIMFLFGSVFLVLGIALFTLGAEMAIEPMGEAIGSSLIRTRKLPLIIISCFLLGMIVTLAEPDLQVLTRQVPAVPDLVLVVAVAIGVGLFLVLALLRILFQLSLAKIFRIGYGVIFAVAAFTGPDFLAVGFDAGGVTTGPITVPFILALGAGISAVRGSKNADQDSFGLCALCSIGPILTVLLMGIFYDASESGYAYDPPAVVQSMGDAAQACVHALSSSFFEVLTVLLPVALIFVLFQVIKRQLSPGQLIRIGVGLVYTLLGLTIFLAGVNLGFLPVGTLIGKTLASSDHSWTLIPLSALTGFFVVYAEPAVHVLNKQVEDITGGKISQKMMMTGISIGVSIALVLSVVRVLYSINIWWFLLPGYAIALILTFFTPKLFTAVAFDSGGVASGTMAAAFLLPFTVGICESVGGNIMTDAFGVIALVAMMPLISMQLLGVIYQSYLNRHENEDDDTDEQDVEATENNAENSESKEDTTLQEPKDMTNPEVPQDVVPEVQETIPEPQDTISEAQDTVPEAQDTVPEAQDTVPEAQNAMPEAPDIVSETLDTVPEPQDPIDSTKERSDHDGDSAHSL